MLQEYFYWIFLQKIVFSHEKIKNGIFMLNSWRSAVVVSEELVLMMLSCMWSKLGTSLCIR